MLDKSLNYQFEFVSKSTLDTIRVYFVDDDENIFAMNIDHPERSYKVYEQHGIISGFVGILNDIDYFTEVSEEFMESLREWYTEETEAFVDSGFCCNELYDLQCKAEALNNHIMFSEETLKQMVEDFNNVYSVLYDAYELIDYSGATEFGDRLLKKHAYDLVRPFCKVRGDLIMSDREAAAFGIVAKRYGVNE